VRALKTPIFQKIVNCYKDYLSNHLVSIVLFGSHARGDAKETSDFDLFIIAEELPVKVFQRILFIRKPLKGQFAERICIVAKTSEEVLKNLPSLFLDLGLDGIILFDKNNFFKNLQTKIREIIQQAGLQRKKVNGEFYWEWQTPPLKGWEITWNGYRAF
jgi:predicted nucleotidyltransferase